MVEQVFSDGIGAIAIISGTVRIDFMTILPDEKDPNGQPKVVPVQRIIMTPEGFARSAEKILEAAQTLSKLAAAPRPGADRHPAENPPSVTETAEPSHRVASLSTAAAQPLTPPKRPFP